jgi:hypothetical protein
MSDDLADILARLPANDRAVLEQHLRQRKPRGGDAKASARAARDGILREIAAHERGTSLADTANRVFLKLRRDSQLRARVAECGLKLPSPKRVAAILRK